MMKSVELSKISGPDNLVFVLKLFIYIGLLWIGLYVSLAHSYVMGIILTGVTIAHGIELQHQVLHGTALSNRTLNYITGFLLGLPMLTSYSSYKYNHLSHHKNVGTEDDLEFFEFNNLKKGYGPGRILFSFFLISHFRDFFRIAIMSLTMAYIGRTGNKTLDRTIRIEHVIILLALLTLLSISAWFDSYHGLIIWLTSVVLVSAPVHTIIELPEHFECDNQSSDILRNTRTISTSALAVWLTNGNNYHIEHHMYPLVRPEKLALVHRSHSHKCLFTNSSYIDFFRKLWGQIH